MDLVYRQHGWMWQLVVETLLGMSISEGNRLWFRPCVPAQWRRWAVSLRYRQTYYRIEFVVEGQAAERVVRVALDGSPQTACDVRLADDRRREHSIVVTLGPQYPN